MEKILLLSLKLNFTPNTLGCYALKMRVVHIRSRDTRLFGLWWTHHQVGDPLGTRGGAHHDGAHREWGGVDELKAPEPRIRHEWASLSPLTPYYVATPKNGKEEIIEFLK